MASIIKRGKTYSVIYTHTKDGQRKQQWETYRTRQEAEQRKQQLEFYTKHHKQKKSDKVKTVEQLINKYVHLHGLTKWSMSTYEGNMGLIRNYINPVMGQMRMDELSPCVVAELYRQFLEFPQVNTSFHRTKGNVLTPRTLRSIHKLLHSIFEQAVLWEYVNKNPFHKAALPKTEIEKKIFLTMSQIQAALQYCEYSYLSAAIHLGFSGTLRLGEILGLTWEDVDFKHNSVRVCKTLTRVNREASMLLDKRGVIYEFPSVLSHEKTIIVLKAPKTESSNRIVYLPEYVMDQLQDIRQKENLLKYKQVEPNLLFKYPDGRPMSDATINKHFKRLLTDTQLPIVPFHSLRHSSITYKLILSQGNIKAVQGDSGHAQADMITELYGHILDESRKENAIKFEEDFYKTFR